MRRANHRADWPYECLAVARNFSGQSIGSALVHLDLRPAFAKLPASQSEAQLLVRGGATNLPAFWLDGKRDLLFPANLPAKSECEFRVGFKTAAGGPTDSPTNEYPKLLASSVNLAPGGDFENGAAVSNAWRLPNPVAGISFGLSRDGKFGQHCLELTVPANPQENWIGWRSREIPVKPGATYLFSGYLKAVGLKGSAALHAHWHERSGKLTATGPFASTAAQVSGDSEWVNSRAFLQAPPDAAFIQLHLTMNGVGTLRHDGILFAEVMPADVLEITALTRESPDQPLHVWQVNPLVKVFPDTLPGPPTTSVAVELARNEFEPFQLALRGIDERSGSHVKVSVTSLRNASGSTLPAVKVERVGLVPIDHPSAYFRTDVPEWCRKIPHGAARTDGWAGWWPDPLEPNGGFDLARDRTQSLWFTVRASEEAAPGDYRGEVRIEADDGIRLTLPLTVIVLPFALPQSTHLKAIFDFRRGRGGWYGPDPKSPPEYRKWLRFIAEHRLGIDQIEPPPKFSYANGRVSMDATGFDETAHFCFDELGMNVSYTPWFFYQFGWAYPPKKLFGLAPFTSEWTNAFRQAYRLFSDHLRAQGWHDKFVYYISDEPHFDHEFVVEQMKKLCGLIHEVDDTIPIYSSTWRHCAAWDEALDLWGVGQYGCFPVPEMERLQKVGKHFWFTCDGQMATDTPYLATERMLPYYCFKYGVEGFEFWGLTWWTYDPWKLGWHEFIRQSNEGKDYYWVRYPDGDGYLAYPGKAVGVDGPVSSIRLEQVREGLEDYEAMLLLTRLADEAKQAGRSTAAAERALAMVRALVTIPNAGGLRSTEILPHPDELPAIRKAINAALLLK